MKTNITINGIEAKLEGTPLEIAEMLQAVAPAPKVEDAPSFYTDMHADWANEQHFSQNQGRYIQVGDMASRHIANALMQVFSGIHTGGDLLNEMRDDGIVAMMGTLATEAYIESN